MVSRESRSDTERSWLNQISALRAGDRVGYRYDPDAPVGARDENGRMCMPAVEVEVVDVFSHEMEEDGGFSTELLDDDDDDDNITLDTLSLKKRMKQLRKAAKPYVQEIGRAHV